MYDVYDVCDVCDVWHTHSSVSFVTIAQTGLAGAPDRFRFPVSGRYFESLWRAGRLTRERCFFTGTFITKAAVMIPGRNAKVPLNDASTANKKL